MGLGKAIASVPKSQVMDVYNAFAKVVPGAVPNMMFNMVNPLDANAAAKAFYTFKAPCRRFSAERVEWRSRSCNAACAACILRGCGFRSMYSFGAVLAVSRDSMPITLTACFRMPFCVHLSWLDVPVCRLVLPWVSALGDSLVGRQ